MRAIKRINNNAAICVDGSGRQLIALGRGVGFGDMPREVSLKDVKRTFYGVDPKYLSFIDEVDPDILEFSAQFADIVTQQLSYELSSNLPITLADHIQFAIKRAREHMVVSMPLAVDDEQAHPVEYRLAEIALKGIQRTFGVRMPKGEAAGIALSIVSSAVGSSARTAELSERTDRLLAGIVQIVEADMGVKVDQSSFAYTRFTTHLRYLLDRIAKGKPVESENLGLYEVLEEQYPEVVACARRIAGLISRSFDAELTREELIYLILHVNRIIGVTSGVA